MSVPDPDSILLESKRSLRFCLCLISAASAVTCIVMPVLAVQGYFMEFRVPYSVAEHARILTEQCVGPLYTLLVVLPFAFLSLAGRKRIPWWSWLLGLVGPIYTYFTARMVAHEFSHTLFRECSGIYGEWVRGICALGGLALVVLASMAFNERRMLRSGEMPLGTIFKTALPYQLETTSAGDRFLRLWAPAGAVLLGLAALATGCYTQFRTDMVGTPAILHGAALMTIGLATFGLPAGDGAVRPDKVQRFAKLRLQGGLALSAGFLIAAVVSMF